MVDRALEHGVEAVVLGRAEFGAALVDDVAPVTSVRGSSTGSSTRPRRSPRSVGPDLDPCHLGRDREPAASNGRGAPSTS